MRLPRCTSRVRQRILPLVTVCRKWILISMVAQYSPGRKRRMQRRPHRGIGHVNSARHGPRRSDQQRGPHFNGAALPPLPRRPTRSVKPTRSAKGLFNLFAPRDAKPGSAHPRALRV